MFVLMNLLLTISSLVVPVLTFSKENANISTDCLNEKVQLKIVPRSIILNERDVLKFKCVMMTHNRSLPAREIVWTKNNVVLHEKVTKIHTDGNVLWVSNPDDEDIGFYKCIQKSNLSNYARGIVYRRRQNALSHHYEKAILRRNIRSSTNQSIDVPVVGSSKDQTGIIGEIGYIRVNITGVWTKIVWRKESLYLIEWPYRGNTIDLKYSAFENGTLKIIRLAAIHNGTFEVAVTNTFGTTHYYPEITVRYPSTSVKQTDDGNCGKYIKCSDCKTIRKRSYRSRRDVNPSYLCDPSNPRWPCQAPIVKTAPPKCVKLWAGQTLELKCDFVGSPNVFPRWEQSSGTHRFKNKMAASNGRIRVEYGENNHRLIIKNIQRKDQNTYHCVGRNYFGTVVLHTQVKVIDYSEFCGSPYKDYQSRLKRVTGGGVTTPMEWPWQAWLTYSDSVPNNIYCGGVVVNSRWVMTAYHCILQYNSLVKLSPDDLVLTVGVWNTSLPNEKSRQSVQVKKIHVPENVFNIDKDMVLLELENPIFFSKSVRPICIGAVVPNPETNCEVSGYGLTGLEGPPSHVLKRATVPLVHAYECRRFYSYLPIPINAICAGLPFGGGGSCPGDSGGPLVCKREGKNQWDLIGLVSGGKGCGHGYTYFSNVVDNRQWIIETAELASLVNL